MALAASLNVNLGLAPVRTAAMGSATVLIVLLPSSNSDLSRLLNSSRGRSRKSAATRTSGSMLASNSGSLPSARTSNTSTARLSCSTFFASTFASFFRGSFLPGFRERLGIGTLQSRPQRAERTELQLLHSALGLVDLAGHFFNAFLFHEPQHHHATLLGRQRVYEPEYGGPALDLFDGCPGGQR